MFTRCFACDRAIKTEEAAVLADTRDDQLVYIGRDCFAHVKAGGDAGWQPPKGGPRLYTIRST